MSQSVGSDGKVTESGGTARVGADGSVQQMDQSGQEQSPAARPEGLPEGMASWQDLAKAYEELKAGKTPPGNSPPPPPPPPQEQQQQEVTDPRFAPFTEEFTKSGTLTDESKKKAAETFGVPLAVVEQYLRGAANAQSENALLTENETLKAQKLAEPFHKEVGDEAQYTAFREWSASGMTDADVAAFDTLLQQAEKTGNIQPAMDFLKPHIAKFKADGNSNPRDITRGNSNAGGGSGGVQPYASMAEQKKDQGDARYTNDPAFRKTVEQRIAISNYSS